MTHDGMWFFHCLQECGIEITNKINKAAVKSLAKIEIKRIQDAFNIERIKSFGDLQDIIKDALDVFKADFMGFKYLFPVKNHMHCEMDKCWAYDGIKRLGVIDEYECGIFDRIDSWLDNLGIKYNVSPIIENCLMNVNGRCYRDYTFYFNE
ncbi:MAG: hypothetical protein ACFFAT_20845 [Promethearchaeota archaeon]